MTTRGKGLPWSIERFMTASNPTIRKYAVFTVLLAAAGCVRSDDARPAKPPSRPAAARPAWVKQGIVMAGNWEPLTFLRRRGGQSVEDIENWPLERTGDVARKLKQAGVNLVITNLHKGFGLAAEARDMEATRRFTEKAHQEGVRVGGYVGATMMYETFFTEEPPAREWMQVDEWGRPFYYYDDQTFRYVACRNNPGYQAFIQRVLQRGIRDLKLDLIHFDQMEFWPEPQSCRCKNCRERFRQFLTARYSKEGRMPRFGFERLDAIEPPPFGPGGEALKLGSLRNPLMQEWALFRIAGNKRHYSEYDDYIYSLNPQVALEGNPDLDMAANLGFTHGIEAAELLEHGDVVWSENPHHASWTADGRLVSKIRDFKAARIMGKSIFIYTGIRPGTPDKVPASPSHLRLAEAMAFNDMNLGMVGDVSTEGVELTPEAERYIRFFHDHAEILRNTVPASGVAVLRSLASLAFNPSHSLPNTVLFEQTLIQNQIPFDIVFDRHLADLSRYRVLVLADQDALSDAQLAQIRAFVERGGGLVATGESSLRTEWLLERRKFGLADLLGADRPGRALRRAFGRGRVAYIPNIQAAMEPPVPEMNYNFRDKYWKLPRNASELLGAVVWAGAGRVVNAPLHVAAELVEQRGTGRMLLHLVNYNFSREVRNLDAAIPIPADRTVRDAIIETPDGASSAVVAVTMKGGAARFRVPRLKVYDLVRLELRKTTD